MARDGRGRLGLGDRLILLVAWITTCGLVYLLGFYVGEGTQARSLRVEQQVVRLPVTSAPPPEGQRPKTEPEFGFYDKLMGEQGAERAPDKVHEEAKPVQPAAHVLPRLAVAAAPALASKPSPPAPAPAPAAAKVPPRPFHVTADVPERISAPRPPARAPGASSEPPRGPGAAPARLVPPPAASLPPAALAAGGFTVLANPTRSREEADGLAKQLRGRGYDATLVRVVRDGDTWYRVQVGRFTTAEQAEETMHRLREHEGVEHAFVASE